MTKVQLCHEYVSVRYRRSDGNNPGLIVSMWSGKAAASSHPQDKLRGVKLSVERLI